MSIETIVSIVTLLVGGSGIGSFLGWRYGRRKEKAEAENAEATAAKDWQDVYQQLIEDVKADRNEQKEYIAELKSDRNHLREDRDALRERLDKTDETVRALQREVARNGRMVEGMRPFMCGDTGCRNRQRVSMAADGEVTTAGMTSEKATDRTEAE